MEAVSRHPAEPNLPASEGERENEDGGLLCMNDPATADGSPKEPHAASTTASGNALLLPRVETHVTDAPPFWATSPTQHNRSISTISYQSIAHHRPTPILLEDHSGEGHELSQSCWARSATIDGYVVVSGPTGIGAYVVWHVTVKTLKGGDLCLRKRYSEFDQLRTDLVRSFPHAEVMIPQLPRKSVVSRFRPKFLEQRMAGLSHFLNFLIAMNDFSEYDFEALLAGVVNEPVQDWEFEEIMRQMQQDSQQHANPQPASDGVRHVGERHGNAADDIHVGASPSGAAPLERTPDKGSSTLPPADPPDVRANVDEWLGNAAEAVHVGASPFSAAPLRETPDRRSFIPRLANAPGFRDVVDERHGNVAEVAHAGASPSGAISIRQAPERMFTTPQLPYTLGSRADIAPTTSSSAPSHRVSGPADALASQGSQQSHTNEARSAGIYPVYSRHRTQTHERSSPLYQSPYASVYRANARSRILPYTRSQEIFSMHTTPSPDGIAAVIRPTSVPSMQANGQPHASSSARIRHSSGGQATVALPRNLLPNMQQRQPVESVREDASAILAPTPSTFHLRTEAHNAYTRGATPRSAVFSESSGGGPPMS